MRHQSASDATWIDIGKGRLTRPVTAAFGPAMAQFARAGSPGQTARSTSVQSLLAEAIRGEVLPRLALAHRAMTAPIAGDLPSVADCRAVEVADLADVAIRQDASRVLDFVNELAGDEISVADVYLDLLAPAARRLGEMWSEDRCDIADVTLGLWRLREVMRDLGPAFHREVISSDHGRAVLLLPSPGETHSFGLQMVSDFFARAGWNVFGSPHMQDEDIGEWVRGESFAIVGFSAHCETGLDALAEAIRLVRRRSRNRAVGVMVGGPVFAAHPELAAEVGADATASDGRQTVVQANGLMRAPSARRG